MAEGTWRGRGPDLPFLHLGAVCVWGEPARVVLGQKACRGGVPPPPTFPILHQRKRTQGACVLPEAPSWRGLAALELEASSVGSQVVSEAWWAFGGGPFGEKAHLDGGQEGGTK